MLDATIIPIFGTKATASTRDALPAATARPIGTTFFSELVGLYQSNETLLGELGSVNRKLSLAREYLTTPGNNPVLGQAYLLRLRARRSAVLTLLRANRVKARDFLAPENAAVPA